MAFMTRRPPSLISWNDAEIQLYLQSILMPSLVVDLNNLNLNDLDENDSNSGDANGHDDGDSASMSSHDETLTTSDTSKRTSSEAKIVVSGQKSTSSFMTSVDTKPSFLASPKGMESAHPAPDPNKPSSTSSTTTTTTVQDLPSLQSNGRDRDLSSFNIPPRRVVFAIASGIVVRYLLLSPINKKIHSIGKSQLSTTQKPRLSLGAIPDMTIDTVPLRDLALASTMSYEAVLAATMVSPSAVADPIREYGTIRSDFAFIESSKDRDGE
ncbi:uncharacterized protein N7469_004221 [Penicillium citrinum]|uniref:Uncharacterized protein n=1 Tax=Penicillium citrinum TaxID=5077 RepID=A0A9W9P432_PENCI|nr:uncharacterized protein N7469_004221 [Penicillium citrinum]KAJ5235053.1 hypothetical protein N7469_004221 [Penicillium citrinum]